MMAQVRSNPRRGPDQVLPADSIKSCKLDTPVQLQMTSSGCGASEPVSVYSLLKKTAEDKPLQKALAVRVDNEWTYKTYEEYFEESCAVAKAFIELGLEPHHGVCIMGSNSPHWLIANFGAIFAGGISTGVYTTNSPAACRHLASDSKAQILVLEDHCHLQNFQEVMKDLPHVKAIIQWGGPIKSPGVLTWDALLKLGRSHDDTRLNRRLQQQAVNMCCSLVYTSGTTGMPKGVMCSQDNFTYTALNGCAIFNPDLESRDLVSYLPLSHIAAILTDCYSTVISASTVHFAPPDALKGSLLQTLLQVQPHGFLGVPRVWEKIYSKLQESDADANPRVKWLTDWAKQCSLNHYQAIIDRRSLSTYEQFELSLARRLVLDRIKAAIGLNRVIASGCGGAPLDPKIAQYFLSLDLPVNDAYGLSETTGGGCSNYLTANGLKTDSVGKVLPYAELKLKPLVPNSGVSITEGEICFRGRSVCMGYLGLLDTTNEQICEDGWLRTGDIGRLDEDGFLYITGRAKEIIITAGGENVPPILIENAIKKLLPVVSNVMLIGDNRKFLSILLTVKCEVDGTTGAPLEALAPSVVSWCAERGTNISTVQQFVAAVNTDRQGCLAADVQAAIDSYNKYKAISNAQKVRRWVFLSHDFSQVTGELNNTLKLKRSVAAGIHANVIDVLYGNEYEEVMKSKL